MGNALEDERELTAGKGDGRSGSRWTHLQARMCIQIGKRQHLQCDHLGVRQHILVEGLGAAQVVGDMGRLRGLHRIVYPRAKATASSRDAFQMPPQLVRASEEQRAGKGRDGGVGGDTGRAVGDEGEAEQAGKPLDEV